MTVIPLALALLALWAPITAAAQPASTGSSTKAPASSILWDGRIPAGSTPALFDSTKSPYGTSSVFGEKLSFSKLILIPNVTTPSLFDAKGKDSAFEVTVSDASVFVPGGNSANAQYGLRRAELNPAINNSVGSPAVSGTKTLHFSIMLDPSRAFNLSHEYQMVFLETADYSNTQFTLKAGTILDGAGVGGDPKTLILTGYGSKEKLFSTPFTSGWHNFALELDFTKNMVEVYYSIDSKPLTKANTAGAVANNMAGGGSYHFGILKKSTGGGSDVVHKGFQETGINEGIIYGGIFIEDSAQGGVTLSPS